MRVCLLNATTMFVETHARAREKAHIINSSVFSFVEKLSTFSIAFVLTGIIIECVSGLAFLHMLTNTCYFLIIITLIGVRENIIVDLIFTSLIINDIEYFHILVNCFSSRSLYSVHLTIIGANSYIAFPCFLLSCFGTLHSSDTNPLSDKGLTNLPCNSS